MKSILVLTDFSECAEAASNYAIILAQKNEADIHFLHLLLTPIDWIKLSKEKEKQFPETLHAIGHARSNLKRSVENAKKQNLKAKYSLVFGAGREEVLQYIQIEKHDFIVMGSNGIKGIKERIIGSNAQQIIRKATIPVLIVKSQINEPIKNILFVSDFTDISIKSFHILTHFAELLDSNIDLLFVNTPGQFKKSAETSQNMDRVMTYCNREESCTRNEINASSVEEGINDFMTKVPIDLIAICTHGKSGFQQLFSPSIAEKIANHTLLPLLSIKL